MYFHTTTGCIMSWMCQSCCFHSVDSMLLSQQPNFYLTDSYQILLQWLLAQNKGSNWFLEFYPFPNKKHQVALFLVCTQHAHRFFSSGGTCTLLPSFLGVHPNFGRCNVPSNSSFRGTKKINCIFSTQGRAFCILRVIDTGLSLLYRVGENFFFCLTLGQTGTGVLFAFVSVPPFFCNIVYNLSNFVFYTELNARLPIYSHDH